MKATSLKQYQNKFQSVSLMCQSLRKRHGPIEITKIERKPQFLEICAFLSVQTEIYFGIVL